MTSTRSGFKRHNMETAEGFKSKVRLAVQRISTTMEGRPKNTTARGDTTGMRRRQQMKTRMIAVVQRDDEQWQW